MNCAVKSSALQSIPHSRATSAYTPPTLGHRSISVPPASKVTTSISGKVRIRLDFLLVPEGLHFQIPHQKRVPVGSFLDNLCGGLAGAVTGFRLDSDQDRIATGLSVLDGRG